MYRRLNVYTAYEFLGRRFDAKTRLLGAALFLLQRGLAAGITIYAPAIILSTVLHWRPDATIVLTGLVVIVYTAAGRQRGGERHPEVPARRDLLRDGGGVRRPADEAARGADALRRPGPGRRLRQARRRSTSRSTSNRRYTFWSGLLGGFFLALSYFGTDQSQVQRYLSGASLRESRLGLMFNAVFKIPMQFFILLLGPWCSSSTSSSRRRSSSTRRSGKRGCAATPAAGCATSSSGTARLHAEKRRADRATGSTRGMPATVAGRAPARAAGPGAPTTGARRVRAEAKAAPRVLDPRAKTNDTDYVFITFILRPPAARGDRPADRRVLRRRAVVEGRRAERAGVDDDRRLLPASCVAARADDAHYVAASKWFTVLWGLVAIAFALFANLAENLIQAVNIVGSIFYGVVLGLFLVAFFLRRVGGTAVFWAALAAQVLVFVLYATPEHQLSLVQSDRLRGVRAASAWRSRPRSAPRPVAAEAPCP